MNVDGVVGRRQKDNYREIVKCFVVFCVNDCVECEHMCVCVLYSDTYTRRLHSTDRLLLLPILENSTHTFLAFFVRIPHVANAKMREKKKLIHE